jgi:hypothetical protein
MISIGGIVVTLAVATYMVVQLRAQQATPAADFTNAMTAEVRDTTGQAVLRGQFTLVEEEDSDVERKAELKPAGSDTDAAGEAEVEYAKASPKTQEVEFSVRNLQAGATYTFVVDGTEVAVVTADKDGRAEVELEVRMP